MRCVPRSVQKTTRRVALKPIQLYDVEEPALNSAAKIMGLVSWIKTTAQHARDSFVETGARAYLNHLLKRFGTMTNLTIDSKTKTIHAELDLKGETSPIKIDVTNYILQEEKGELFIEFNGIRTSREWLNLVADQFLQNKRVKIPGYLKAAL